MKPYWLIPMAVGFPQLAIRPSRWHHRWMLAE